MATLKDNYNNPKHRNPERGEMSKEKKLSKDDLLYVFNELVTNATTFKPKSLQQERDEAIQRIYQLIELSAQEPSEAEVEEFVEKQIDFCPEISRHNKDEYVFWKHWFLEMLKEYDKLRRG